MARSSEGNGSSPLAAQVGGALERYPPEERARFLALPDAARRPGDVALEVVERENGRWTVAIATEDFLGALSLLVGLLTADGLEVVAADILTLQVSLDHAEGRPRRGVRAPVGRAPRTSVGRRILFDVFEVRGAPAPERWTRFRAQLGALLAPERREPAREEILDRVSATVGALEEAPKLLPIAIDVTNDPADARGLPIAPTTLTVRSADTPGFLFAFTNALTGLALDVHRAEIRTVDGEARDTFWVTDQSGRPIVTPHAIQELRVATTLIKQFTSLLPRSPDPAQALRQFNALIVQMLARPRWTAELVSLESPAVLESLAELMGVSRFLWEDFLRLQHESLFPLLLDAPSLDERSTSEWRAELDAPRANADSLAQRVEQLNAFKDRELFRIDLRHLVGRSGFVAFARELSELAEVTVQAALDLAGEELAPRFGRPRLPDGRECPVAACALGKFGGRELGFGSDLELIFVYEGAGLTDGRAAIPNSEYFGYLVQAFLRILRARQEGIFEIDLRLRPFGRAGALASSLDGFATYYSARGSAEQFERLALVRLRPVAGDRGLGERVETARDAFVYSGRPLDLANIRHLRHRQSTELVPRGQVNVKYSAGGLVDLEYFVQARQIQVGATDSGVRVTNTLEAVRRLEEGGDLSPEQAGELRAAYDLLRRLIDSLRVVRGHAKDLTLPPDGSREFAYLARRLKLPSPAALRDAIDARMAFARSLWEDGRAGPSGGDFTE